VIQIIHEIGEGLRIHLGFNYYRNSRSTTVSELIIPLFAWFFDPFYAWERDCWLKGWRFYTIQIYFRIRDKKNFPQPCDLPRFVIGFRSGWWNSGKESVVATAEEIQDGQLNESYIFGFDNKLRRI
jgi:hypothetical protein